MPKKAVKKAAAKPAIKKAAKQRGGARAGAGRPKGTGKFGCETKAVRVPIHLADEIQAFIMKRIKTK